MLSLPQLNEKIVALVDELETLKEKLRDEGTLKDLVAHLSGDVGAIIENKEAVIQIRISKFLDNLFEYVKTDSENTARFSRIIDYVNNPENFVLAPTSIMFIPALTTIQVKWETVEDAQEYDVYFRRVGEQFFKKSGATPVTGMTISGLERDTEYEIYIVTRGKNGKFSLPSQRNIAKTKL